MKSLFLIPLLYVGSSVARPGPNTAAELWKELAERHAAAQGLELRGKGSVELDDGISTISMTIEVEARIARPVHGRLRLEQKSTTGDSTVELVGLGEKLVLVDHGSREHFPVADTWVPLIQPEPGLLAAWRGEEVQPKSVRWVEADERPAALGLEVEFERHTETIWVVDGVPVAVDLTATGGGQTARLEFEQWKLHAEVDIDAFRAAPPADYEDKDPLVKLEKNLLAVGDSIPDLAVVDLAGHEVPLSTLRGKTLLLNFWFYH